MNTIKQIFSRDKIKGFISGLLVSVMMLASFASASTITTINGSDSISGSRTTINTNFSNLNTDKVELTNTSAWSNLQKLFANASSTGFSANQLWIGGTATTSIDNSGKLTLATTTAGCASVSSTGIVYSNGQACGTSSATVTSVGLSDSNSTLTIGGTPITTSGTLTATLNLAHSNIWSVIQSFNYSSSTAYSSFVTASTSNLILNGSNFYSFLGTGLSNSAGILTVSAVPNSALSNSTISGIALGGTLGALTATNGSLTFSGSYTGNTAQTVGLNVGNANSWTALQTFTNITTTNATSSGKLNIPNGTSPSVVTTGDIALDTTSDQLIAFGGSAKKVYGNGNNYASFTYATSSTWGATATTTIPLGTARVAETWNDIQCFTDTGTLFVDLYHTSTHANSRLNASTTANANGYTSNNTLTAGEKRYVDIGTPASSPKSVSCTLSKSITAD